MHYKFTTLSFHSHSSTEEIRPSFIHALSPNDKGPDEVLFPTTEHSNPHKEEPSLACHPVSFCLEIDEETDNSTPGAHEEKKVTESWNVPKDELEDTVASDRQEKWELPLSNPTEEITSGGEDGGALYQQPESKTIKTGRMPLLPSGYVTRQETRCDAHSPKPMRNVVEEEGVELIVDSENMTEAGTGQMSNTEHEESWRKERGYMDATLLNKKGSANKMGGIWFLGTNKNTSLERNLGFLPTSIMDKIFDCDTEGKKLGEREENDFEFRVNTPEVKDVERPLDVENKEILMGCHPGNPKKISISLEKGDHKVSPYQAENTQDTGQTETGEKYHTENPLVQGETKLILDDDTADNLERTTEERIEAMEVRLEVETESRTKGDIDTSTEDKMETEQQHCSDVQLRERQCETDCREASELPGRDTEPGERRRDRDESVMPPVVGEDESTPTGKGMMGLICNNTVSYLLGFF